MTPCTARNPCLICGGHDGMKSGTESRCWGFLSGDGDWAHCTRGELAGSIKINDKTQGYPHLLGGLCNCGATHVPAAPVNIGEANSARVVAEYEYTDESGAVLFKVVRKEPKAFLQQRPDGQWGRGDSRLVPYRLSEVIEGVLKGYEIWIAEGEKDVENLREAGAFATCNAGGAGKWLDSFSEFFHGAKVAIIADRDEPGIVHARKVYSSLVKVAESVRVVEARDGKDASDHLAAGYGLNEFVAVYPIDSLRETDPVAWKRAIILRSDTVEEQPIKKADHAEELEKSPYPSWPHALEGPPNILEAFRGLTIIAGGPSAGKTWLAIGSAISAARAGWNVLYITAEMGPAQILRRATGYCDGGQLPDGFQVIEAGFGSSVGVLKDFIAEEVDERKVLVVMDSISSFVDQSIEDGTEDDVHNIGPLKAMTMWALNVKNKTHGEVSFLILSEKNAKGETKGRFGDHKADLVVSIAVDQDGHLMRSIAVTKAWESQLGSLGCYQLDPDRATLRWVANDLD